MPRVKKKWLKQHNEPAKSAVVYSKNGYHIIRIQLRQHIDTFQASLIWASFPLLKVLFAEIISIHRKRHLKWRKRIAYFCCSFIYAPNIKHCRVFFFHVATWTICEFGENFTLPRPTVYLCFRCTSADLFLTFFRPLLKSNFLHPPSCQEEVHHTGAKK